MSTFEITIQHRSGDGWPIVALWNPEGALLPVRKEDVLSLDRTLLGTQVAPLDYGACPVLPSTK